MQNILEIINLQKLLGCRSKSSLKRLVNKNCFVLEEKYKMCITDQLTEMVISTYQDLNFSLSLDASLCLLRSTSRLVQQEWQECSQMLIKNLLQPPQWQWDYEANAPFHTYPSSWSGEMEEKMSLQTLSSALLCPSNTHAQQPMQLVPKGCLDTLWGRGSELFPQAFCVLKGNRPCHGCSGENQGIQVRLLLWTQGACWCPLTTKGTQRNSLTYGIPQEYWTLNSLRWLQENIHTHSHHFTSTGGCCS